MKGVQCLFNSRAALYRVFISPVEGRETTTQLARQLHPLLNRPPTTYGAQCSFITSQVRHYVVPNRRGQRNPDSHVKDDDRGFDKRFTTQRDIDRSGRSRPPWDHEITDPQIMVIDNGEVEGPLATRFVMTKLEPEESLRMIQPYVPGDTKEHRPTKFAVCKIVNKRAEYERQKKLKDNKKASAATKVKTKELELTWGIGDHDLATKMRKMGEFLTKGWKVEVMLGRKKGGKTATEDEAEAVLKKIREEVEVHRGREAKMATGDVGKTMKLYLEGVAQK